MRGGRGKGALGGRRAAAPGSAHTLERGCGPSSPSAPGVRAPGGGAREPRAQEEEGGRLLGGPGKERAAGGIPNPLLPSLPPSLRPPSPRVSRLPFFLRLSCPEERRAPPLILGRSARPLPGLPFPPRLLPGAGGLATRGRP